jgi:hypothetical protein
MGYIKQWNVLLTTGQTAVMEDNMSITQICHDGASSGDDGQHQIPEGDVNTATLPVFTFATSP